MAVVGLFTMGDTISKLWKCGSSAQQKSIYCFNGLKDVNDLRPLVVSNAMRYALCARRLMVLGKQHKGKLGGKV
jgi:hypothetical protein